MQISATIITYNEERHIEACIKSLLSVADEIIVVDSFSTDDTANICRSIPEVRFLENEFEGHIQQKNYALDQTNFDYVLSLDADERLSLQLQQEILRVKKFAKLPRTGYFMPRLNNYCGKWIKHGGWYPDPKLRLWNKNYGRWAGINPHDKVVLQKNIALGVLKGDILHYTYQTTAAHDRQIEKFATIAAVEAFKKNKKVIPFFHLYIYPVISFVQNYFIKLGFLDGQIGFTLGRKHMYYKYLKYKKLLTHYEA